MSEMTIEVHKREATGKNENRRLRAAGSIPAVVYGGGKEPVPIRVDRKMIHELLKQAGGENAVFLLKLAGTAKGSHTMVREVVTDPISRQILHVDFQRILMTEKVRVQVSVEVAGTPVGVKSEGGVMDFVTRELEIECLPADIPPSLELDVSALGIGDHLEAKDLVLPAGVELLEEPDRVIVAVAHSRVAAAVEEAEAEAGEELLEAEQEEPELIGREPGEETGDESSGT